MESPGPEDLTEQQLAEVIELVRQLGETVAQNGFTTREYCEATGTDSSPQSRPYRLALNDLTRLKDAGLVESGVCLQRKDVHGRPTTVMGWRLRGRPGERPPQSEEEDPPP